MDPEDRVLTNLFDEVSASRRRRIRETCGRLSAAGVPLAFEEVGRDVPRQVARPSHVADALVRKGVVRNRREAFDRYLGDGKAGHVSYGWKISVTEAAKLLHNAGGLTSIAHPKYLDDQAALVPMLRESGVQAVEAYHTDQDASERERYLTIADSLGLLVTGGSDFHGRENGKRFGSELPPDRYRELLSAAHT